MARRILISRRDWMQNGGASFDASVGFWSPAKPLTNLLDLNPQLAAEAIDNRDIASTRFVADLGIQRRVGLIAFAALRCTGLAFMRVQAGTDPTFVSNTYDSGMIAAWPIDSTPGELDAWDRWTLNGIYNEDEYAALGMPRVFIPSTLVNVRYVRVIIRNQTARDPLTIGCFGVYDVWESPVNFETKWELTPVDDSVVTRVPRGSSFVDRRGVRRKLNLAFPPLPDDEIWSRGFGSMLVKGRSEPFWVVPFSDSNQITRFEKAAVYGLVSQDSALSNPFYGHYVLPVQIEQLY